MRGLLAIHVLSISFLLANRQDQATRLLIFPIFGIVMHIRHRWAEVVRVAERPSSWPFLVAVFLQLITPAGAACAFRSSEKIYILRSRMPDVP